MDRTLFFGVVAALGAAAGLAGWALGWPGPALVAVAAGWARMQLRLGDVARAGALRPDAVTAALPWGAVLAAAIAVGFLVVAA